MNKINQLKNKEIRVIKIRVYRIYKYFNWQRKRNSKQNREISCQRLESQLKENLRSKV